MNIDEIKKDLNYGLGAKLRSFFISTEGTTTPVEEARLDDKTLKYFIDILSSDSITIEIKFYLNADQILLDIPLTERFITTFAKKLTATNRRHETHLGVKVHHIVRDLIYSEVPIPHFLTLHAYVHSLSDEELGVLENLPSHAIDLGSFEKKGQVIGAALSLEAMATKASTESLKEYKPKKSWEKRLSRKPITKNAPEINFFDHIQHLQENKILSKDICHALHKLRQARNAAAHNFDIHTKENSEASYDYIEVTQADQHFISAVSDFVATCKSLYGPVPKTFRDIFKRHTELLAGDINKFAKTSPVFTLEPHYPKELSDIFG
jgi:hypothetical protein